MFQKYFFNNTIRLFSSCESITLAQHPAPNTYTVVGDFIKLKLPHECSQFQYDFVELYGGLTYGQIIIVPIHEFDKFHALFLDIFPEIRLFPQLYRQQSCNLYGDLNYQPTDYQRVCIDLNGILMIHTIQVKDRRGPVTLHPDDTTPYQKWVENVS